jgi:DNA-binding beta-propeller fold protein YncE
MKVPSSLCLVLVAALAAVVSGCQSTPSKPPEPVEIVFPPPPDEPRFVFERTLFSSANIKEDTGTDRFRRAVTGERITGRGFGKPFDVVACKGTIFVSDGVERGVLVFDVPAREFSTIGTDEDGALAQPLGIAVDRDCRLYVADGTHLKVLIYAPDGSYERALGGPEFFHRLSHVAVSPDGATLYATDTGGIDVQEHRVRVFDLATGAHVRDIGSRGSEEGEFNLPRDLEIGVDNRLYIIDGANFRVQVFDAATGRFVRSFGRVGRQAGQFSRPKGIALDPQGRVYVSDSAFGNFQIFQPDGQLLMFIGTRGSRGEPAVYMLPAGIDVDEDGRILMVDQFFRKVDIYRPTGLAANAGYLGQWPGSDAGKP